MATIIANKVLYSYHHIINNLDSDNWYDDIIDYIIYNFESFGSFPSETNWFFKMKLPGVLKPII